MLYITTVILMVLGTVILLYKTYQHHTKPDIKSYLWYKRMTEEIEEPKEIKKQYHCYCDSLQLICQVHRDDAIANAINPDAVKAYWDKRDNKGDNK